MATPITKLPAIDPQSGRVNLVVDTPKGSRNKYKFDESTEQWRLGKVLPQGMSFPYNFGFLPSTKAGDGDPLDVLVLMDEPSFPGCILPGQVIGVLEAEQIEDGKTIRNDRLIAVIETRYNAPEYRSLDEVNGQRLAEIEHFFVSYNEVEGRRFKPLARRGREDGQRVLEAAMKTPGAENGSDYPGKSAGR